MLTKGRCLIVDVVKKQKSSLDRGHGVVCATSLLLLAVLDDSRRIHQSDSLQQLVWHLDAHQLLQETLTELLQGGERAAGVSRHDDALNGTHFLAVHYHHVLGGSGLST